MIYRIKVDLKFPDKAESEEVWAGIVGYFRRKKVINLEGERSFISYEECHHDESPSQPCLILQRLEA